MPSISYKRVDSGTAVFSDNPTEQEPVTTWVLVVIIASIVLIVAFSVFLVGNYIKRKQYRHAKLQDPYLTRKEFTRRRKMSELDRMEEEELQRSIQIRKSLLSRSSRRTSQAESNEARLDDEEEPLGGLREDWKEWEARVQRDQSNSRDQHPSDLSDTNLPIPAQSRPRSPSRSPLLTTQATPTLPSTPTFGPVVGAADSRRARRSKPASLPPVHIQ